MSAPAPHTMMTCPYNPAHQVEHYRMHIHLQKCRKQHTNVKKVVCPFDATHVLNEAEIDYHVMSCPKRSMFDTQKYVIDDDYRPVTDVTEVPNIPTEESWDDDNATTYVPDPSRKGSHIIMKVRGATPSERRKARMEGARTYRPSN